MHLEYEAQLKWKQQKVHNALCRIGKQTIEVAPCLPSPLQLYYRNKIQLPVQGDVIGLYQQRSHDIVDVPHCYIHNESGGKIYEWMRSHLPHRENIRHLLLRTANKTNETLVIIVTRNPTALDAFSKLLMKQFPNVIGVIENHNSSQTNKILGRTNKVIAGRGYLIEHLLDKQFKIGPTSFFQVNSQQAENLIQSVIQLANLNGSETVYDAYTGVGTFALFLAQYAKRVIGTECVAEAIACAKENASLNNIDNCEFEVANATSKKADLVLLNPPRGGCAPEVLNNLSSDRIIYVSCDPATLARDLTLLPDYKLEKALPFDLFPQTIHVETLALLKKII